tara:strand:- start:710 stop:937 length:228 start_codon:yes stop_codon:yes gene_type:complete
MVAVIVFVHIEHLVVVVHRTNDLDEARVFQTLGGSAATTEKIHAGDHRLGCTFIHTIIRKFPQKCMRASLLYLRY